MKFVHYSEPDFVYTLDDHPSDSNLRRVTWEKQSGNDPGLADYSLEVVIECFAMGMWIALDE